MSKIVWQKGGMSDLTIDKGRSFPVSEPIEINQERYMTESFNAKVISYGSSAKFIQLDISGVPKDNYDGTVNGIKTWFEDSNVNWSENSFTMIDERGNTLTVRFWQDGFSMPEAWAHRHNVSILLKVE